MTIDQGFQFDSIAGHDTPPAGRISYLKNADGTYSPAPMIGGIVYPDGFISAAGANQDSTLVKAGAVTLSALAAQNNHATLVRYLKLYNKATAPTSADTPAARYALAPAGGGITRQPLNENFTLGLAFRITTGQLDNDTGVASAGDVFVNLDHN